MKSSQADDVLFDTTEDEIEVEIGPNVYEPFEG